ncbi:hypothetical protein AWF88_26030 [Escherichia coli]|nr:hypothetical protein AWF88_26030 [Escherichia coli]
MAEINSTAQVTSALTSVSDVLTPVFTLWYLQKNITSDIAPYVTRVTWSDNIKNESDTIEVELDDTDGRWLDKWYPGKGDTLTLKMGYQGEKLPGNGIQSTCNISFVHTTQRRLCLLYIRGCFAGCSGQTDGIGHGFRECVKRRNTFPQSPGDITQSAHQPRQRAGCQCHRVSPGIHR